MALSGASGDPQSGLSAGPAYTIEIRENDRRLSLEPLVDPFINTTVHPRGWRVALAVLCRRYKVSVHVDGDRERVEEVLKLDPDYLGPHNRKQFIEGALHDFAARLAEHDDD